MASEIKVDTISEKTSANGISIDSVVHKDSAVYPSSADGGALGSASNEWSDLFLADSSVIKFGADQDTTLTHTDGTGLTLNSTNKLCFNDVSQFVQGISATVLGLGATDEIDLTATAVDLNGTLDVSGTALVTGVLTTTAATVFTGGFAASAISTITTADNADTLSLISTDADANSGPNLRLYRNSSSPADSDVIGQIDFEGRNDNSQDIVSARIQALTQDVSDGTEDGKLTLNTIIGGTERVRINCHSGGITFNNAAETMRITDDGEFLLGTTSLLSDGYISVSFPATNRGMYLQVESTDNGTNYLGFNNNGTECGVVVGNGSNSVAFTTSSDYRLKENVSDMTGAIDRVKTLKPKRFNWIADEDNTLVDGFFAHEVSGIVPEAINGEKDAMYPEVLYTADDELPEGKNIGDVKEETKIKPQGIDQAKLVPLLTSALQEAITKIETLEAKVAVLEG